MRPQYIPAEKPCTKCGETKPLADFPKDKERSDGRRSCCRACHSAANHAYNLRVKAESPERIKEWSARHYQNHKDDYRQRDRLWDKANPDKVRAIQDRKNKRNRHIKMRWDAKQRGAPDEGVTSDVLRATRAYFNDACAYCLTPLDNPAWDHIVPLASRGPHHPDNIVPACTSCNSKKHNLSLLECLLKGRLT